MMNPVQFMQQLDQFAKTIQGDPKEQVQQLLNSGQLSQQTYGQYSKIAEMLSNGDQQGAFNLIFGSMKN